jgi:uncharacterized protein (TIGR01777 family)
MIRMRVIVTGGTGLIGRALTASLVARRDEVVVLSRDPRRATGLPTQAHLEQWDGASSRGWAAFIDASTAIVNLAGEGIAAGRWTAGRKQRILSSRVNAAMAVVDAVRGAPVKPRVVIQASAVGYYGPRGHDVITEDAPPGRDYLAGVCAQWELASAGIESFGVRRAIIRTGVVLSLAGGALPRLLLPFWLFVGGPLGSGTQELPWIHLDDEVAAILRLIDDDGARGPFNLSAPRPLTNAEFGRVLGRVVGRPAVLSTPSFGLRLAFGEMATVVLDGQRAVPKHLLDRGYAFRYPDAESALRNLLL